MNPKPKTATTVSSSTTIQHISLHNKQNSRYHLLICVSMVVDQKHKKDN